MYGVVFGNRARNYNLGDTASGSFRIGGTRSGEYDGKVGLSMVCLWQELRPLVSLYSSNLSMIVLTCKDISSSTLHKNL